MTDFKTTGTQPCDTRSGSFCLLGLSQCLSHSGLRLDGRRVNNLLYLTDYLNQLQQLRTDYTND